MLEGHGCPSRETAQARHLSRLRALKSGIRLLVFPPSRAAEIERSEARRVVGTPANEAASRIGWGGLGVAFRL